MVVWFIIEFWNSTKWKFHIGLNKLFQLCKITNKIKGNHANKIHYLALPRRVPTDIFTFSLPLRKKKGLKTKYVMMNSIYSPLILLTIYISITAKKFFFRYYLSSAGCLYLCMYLCYCDCSHTVQPRALKLWHNIPPGAA